MCLVLKCQPVVQSCVAWLAKHALLAWPTKPYAQLPSKTRLDVRGKVHQLCLSSSAFSIQLTSRKGFINTTLVSSNTSAILQLWVVVCG